MLQNEQYVTRLFLGVEGLAAVGTLVGILIAPPPIQVSANTPRKAVEKVLGPLPLMWNTVMELQHEPVGWKISAFQINKSENNT